MKHPFFRLRLALLSTLLAGTTLLGFAGLSWKLIYDAKVSRLDGSLAIALSQMGMRRLRSNGANGTTARNRHDSPHPDSPHPERWNPERWNPEREKSSTEPTHSDPQLFESRLARAFSTDDPTGLLILSETGEVLYQSSSWDSRIVTTTLFPTPQSLPALPPRLEFRPDRPPPEPAKFPIRYQTQGIWRIGAGRFPQSQVAIAASLQSIDQEMVTIRNIFAVAIPSVLVLVAGGAWVVAGRALQPIRHLTQVIQAVSSTGLDQRVNSQGIDQEFAQLIQVFNQMLGRLEQSFKQASRFSGDAAHELKTPLAILQGELEQALQHVETGSPLQQQLGHWLEEVQRLSSIVRKLLFLSLADAGQMRLLKTEVDLSQTLRELVEDLDLVAPDLTVTAKIADGLKIWGDRELLTQMLQNLIGNAVKYNLPQGWIQIEAIAQATNKPVTNEPVINEQITNAPMPNGQPELIQISICNTSQDLKESDRPLIFDRFYRGDPARTRRIEGTGLGLSLAREIVQAHGGTLKLEPSDRGQTLFVLKLISMQP
jgi:two-component system, OmpR family, heavy metal sensor histidine kinase CusS